MSTVRFTHAFPPENDLNPAGDFKSLVMTATREKDEATSPIMKTWSIVGEKQLPTGKKPLARVLTPEEKTKALEAVFLSVAQRT